MLTWSSTTTPPRASTRESSRTPLRGQRRDTRLDDLPHSIRQNLARPSASARLAMALTPPRATTALPATATQPERRRQAYDDLPMTIRRNLAQGTAAAQPAVQPRTQPEAVIDHTYRAEKPPEPKRVRFEGASAASSSTAPPPPTTTLPATQANTSYVCEADIDEKAYHLCLEAECTQHDQVKWKAKENN